MDKVLVESRNMQGVRDSKTTKSPLGNWSTSYLCPSFDPLVIGLQLTCLLFIFPDIFIYIPTVHCALH